MPVSRIIMLHTYHTCLMSDSSAFCPNLKSDSSAFCPNIFCWSECVLTNHSQAHTSCMIFISHLSVDWTQSQTNTCKFGSVIRIDLTMYMRTSLHSLAASIWDSRKKHSTWSFYVFISNASKEFSWEFTSVCACSHCISLQISTETL